MARYTEPIDMSIRITSPTSASPALVRETRSLFARSLGFAFVAVPVPVLGGAVGTFPALTALALFAGLLFAVERALGTLERWLLAAVAGAALMLDGADGWAARHQGLTSAFGARFDMEVDAFAILVLAIMVAKAHAVPYWVLAIGAMRYFSLAAALAFPLLRRPLPPRPIADRRRKTIAVIQSVGLTVSLVPATSPGWAGAICGTALALLTYSFAADIIILLSTRPHR